MTWAELARRAARKLGLDPSRVVGRPQDGLKLLARRPAYSVLHSRRATLMPPLEHALDRYFQESGFGREPLKVETGAAELLGA